MNNKKIVKITAFTTGFIFIFVAFFGLNLSMMTSNHDMMPGCPFMNNEATLCTMSLLEHFSQWQKMFAAAIIGEIFIFAILLFFTITIFKYHKIFEYWHFLTGKNLRYKIRLPQYNSHLYLKKIFSRGILHSKLFA